MKQVVQNYKSGELALLDVAEPACKPGGVLVRTRYSLISTGTEMMKVGEASMSLLAKARARPDQVAKVVQSASTIGVAAPPTGRSRASSTPTRRWATRCAGSSRRSARASATSRSATSSPAPATSTRCTAS